MTKAQLDLAHKTIGDLGHCVRAMEQYGNERIAGIMRVAASLLETMVNEAEQHELPLERLIDNARRKGIDVHLADDTPGGD